ncbi:hypothetical protein EDD63_11424 [Breznakia blatticola]|uniref:Uncharacterized protein n=1 Tax=Breznakia blatticola TaxID=1754012 RepID=A0A4V6Q8F1_9FIRM|nr:hypothetical protein [Breznakia blatticola]TDW20194.1 hypothetical protein EDD63_11424 [Breznakia blatticola]
METEGMNIEYLINEILSIPMCTQSKDELEKMSYIELLDLRDSLYGVNVEFF